MNDDTPYWVNDQALEMFADSEEYDILEEAAAMIKGTPGLSLEIGVRTAGSTKKILDVFLQTGQNERTHIGIDPYGDILYQHWEDRIERCSYTNQMRNLTMRQLYGYCYDNNLDCRVMFLEDTEFFKRFADGVPVYSKEKYVINQYALVFFDGPHCVQACKDEFDFFKTRCVPGSMLVFDDINQYPHMEQLDTYIRSHGFEIVRQGTVKISYRKIN